MYAMPDDITECMGADATDDAIRDAMLGELKTYRQYLAGEVYGYMVKSPDGEVLDSCWGFYDDWPYDYLKSEANEMAEWHAEQARKEAEQVAYWASRDVETIA